MGASGEETSALGIADAEPRHRVRITKPFYAGKFEVTVGQFRRFVEAAKYKTAAERNGTGSVGIDCTNGLWTKRPEWTWRTPSFHQGDDHPVIHVDWDDATAFCDWLSTAGSGRYRLPTEAEWEYACRAGTTTRSYAGDSPDDLQRAANGPDPSLKEAHPTIKVRSFLGSVKDHYAYTAPVGCFEANPFQLHDTHGNVWEWCQDWYDERYYAISPRTDPPGPSSAGKRVIRGGSWLHSGLWSAVRSACLPAEAFDDVGFRVVHEIGGR
jgi:formylglycine-generating enzyme required for sulfatase activity